MHPGTIINPWIDQTIETPQQTVVVDNTALFLTASSFDKGPEEMIRVYGDNFYKLFGSGNRFAKHGQPAIQAARIIDAGGELLVKRVVADDATLANVVFLANLSERTAEVEPPVQTAAVSIPDQTTSWLSKPIGDLVDNNIVVDATGTVTGTIKFAHFTDFSSDVALQKGNYFPFVLNTTGTTMTLKVNGTATKENVPFDPEIIFMIKDPTVSYEVEVDGVPYITLDFTNAEITAEDGTVSTVNPAVEPETTTVMKMTAVFIENCYSFADVKREAMNLYDPDNGVYPILVVTDNGRGTSSKAICISRNSEVSVSTGKEFYTVSVYEGTTRTDSITATLDSTVYNDVQYGLEEFSATQTKFYVDPEVFLAYQTAIAEALNVDVDTASKYDLINMQTVKGVLLEGIEVDAESIDMGVTYGVALQGGSNGEFGDNPVNTVPWEEALVEFFSGNFTNEIYDLDEYKIGAVVDANYPYSVKDAIADLVTFREDCVFFRDMRLDADSYGTTCEVLRRFRKSNKFIANYMTWYQIYDPDTKKRIPVTLMYDLAACLVDEFDRGIHYPTAGIANGFILESAIEGTVSYTPRITPVMNQRQMMDDLRVNYAIFQSGQCIVQSLYTSQEAFSQLSYVNNVLGIQEVVRSVRTSCPKKRYTFVNNGDFSDYKDAVDNVLKNFQSNFDHLSFEYYKDTLLAHHKIFYGAIKFAFKDWAQTEIFDVYAIGNDTIGETE